MTRYKHYTPPVPVLHAPANSDLVTLMMERLQKLKRQAAPAGMNANERAG